MLVRLWKRLCWYYRNINEIQRFEKIADDRKMHHFKHMYCELHGSMDCSHSTWNSKIYEAECRKIDDWLKAELDKLP